MDKYVDAGQITKDQADNLKANMDAAAQYRDNSAKQTERKPRFRDMAQDMVRAIAGDGVELWGPMAVGAWVSMATVTGFTEMAISVNNLWV